MVKVTPWKLCKLKEPFRSIYEFYDIEAGKWVLFRWISMSQIYMPWYSYDSFEEALEHWTKRQERTQSSL